MLFRSVVYQDCVLPVITVMFDNAEIYPPLITAFPVLTLVATSVVILAFVLFRSVVYQTPALPVAVCTLLMFAVVPSILPKKYGATTLPVNAPPLLETLPMMFKAYTLPA